MTRRIISHSLGDWARQAAPGAGGEVVERYIHPKVGEEIRAIGGGYTPVKEVLLPVGERAILYVVVVGHADTSCCGAGGCAYATVIGWQVEQLPDDAASGAASLVEPLADGPERERLARLIRAKEKVREVRFRTPQPQAPDPNRQQEENP